MAAGIVRAAPALVPGNVPGLADVAVDGVVLAFTAGLSVAASLLFGIAPALAWSRVDPARTLNAGHGATAGGFVHLRTNRGQSGLAVVQVALALVLLSGAGLLLRSFVAFVTLDRGLDTADVLVATLGIETPGSSWRRGGGRIAQDEMDARNAVVRQASETLRVRMERIGNLPGVAAAALSSSRPLASAGSNRPISVAGRPAPGDPREETWAGVRRVDPGYADVMRLRLQAGRFLAGGDGPGAARVAVVSESLARTVFGDAPAVGQRFSLAYGDDAWEVVGVVADVTPLYGSSFMPVAGQVYLSRLQPERNPSARESLPVVTVRTDGDPEAFVPVLRDLLATIHPAARVYPTTLEATLSREAVQPRFYAVWAGIFAAVALLLAAFGLYGVLSYAVSRRQRELGVRMALGASRTDVVLLVVRQGGMLVAAGAVLGLPAAAAVTRVVESVLFGVTATDAPTFAGVTAVIVAVGLLACWLPARRATRIDPMEVLRFE